MVPKRMEASWAALPPPGRSSSESSSSSESLSEPQSSDTARRREAGATGADGAGCVSCFIRWKGLVEASVGGAGAGGAAVGTGGALTGADGDEASDGWVINLKYGFLLSASAGGEATTVGTDGGEATGEATFRSSSWLPATVGVDAWGVTCSGPSSSEDESSSFMASSCRWSSSSRSFAASISARLAASLASLSLASARAAFFFFFSSSFLSLPCRTCSSRALSRAWAASCSLEKSSSSSLAFSLCKMLVIPLYSQGCCRLTLMLAFAVVAVHVHGQVSPLLSL